MPRAERSCALIAAASSMTSASTHPLARSGTWLSPRRGRRTAVGPKLDAQPVDQPRHFALARRLLDQAVLRRASGSAQLGVQREGVEAEAGVERRRLVGQQPLQMLRLAAGDRGRDRRRRRRCRRPGSRSAPAAARRAAAAASSRDQPRDQQVERLRPPPTGRRPAPPAAASRAAAARRRSAVSGSGLRPSARSSASTGLSASRNRRASDRRAIPASAPMVFSPSRSSVRTVPAARAQRRDRQRRRAVAATSPSPQIARARNCASAQAAAGGRRDRHPRGQPHAPRSARSMSCASAALAAEQMRDPADVEPAAHRAVDLDQRRPARRPARQPLDQRGIAGRVGGDGDQRRVERAGIGQPRAGPRAALRRRLGDGMDDRPVRALDGEDDGLVRRASLALRPALDRQPRQPDAGDPRSGLRLMGDAPAARRRARARGTARHPSRARPARAGRAGWAATARWRSASASAPR